MKKKRILVVNPGSTSTKIAVYEGNKQIYFKKIIHSSNELTAFSHIREQYDFRKKIIFQELEKATINLQTIDVVVGRGGVLKPVVSGVYRINDAMLYDINNSSAEHVSNLGILLARALADSTGDCKEAFIVDPPSVDEMEDVARITGMPEISRISLLHALNQKAVARKFATEINKKYDEINVVVAHMGGGISVSAHKKGKIIDTNNALNGDGPFTPERAGTVPAGQLVELCYSGKFTKDEMIKKLKGKGGLVAHLGTNDFFTVKKMISNDDKKAEILYNAMAYQIAKEIGVMATVLDGNVDGIILTGGIANNENFNHLIIEKVKFIAPVFVYPGENEMEALAMSVLKALQGKIEIKEY